MLEERPHLVTVPMRSIWTTTQAGADVTHILDTGEDAEAQRGQVAGPSHKAG